jgi:hypothetical protein
MAVNPDDCCISEASGFLAVAACGSTQTDANPHRPLINRAN